MLSKKTGYPEEGEIVLCTVTKIYHHSVFVNLDEYGSSGMLHISEVSPGRIRNLRDYVQEGKKIVCKILKINKERGHIDVSLRRVNDNQRRLKLEGIKQEQKAEKILEQVCNNQKKDLKKMYEIFKKHFSGYTQLYQLFEDVVMADAKLVDLGVDAKMAEELEVLIRQRIKPPEVLIGGVLTASCYDPRGVEVIREILDKHTKEMAINYLGAGRYRLAVKAPDFKEAEKILNTSVDDITDFMSKHNGVAEFERQDIR